MAAGPTHNLDELAGPYFKATELTLAAIGLVSSMRSATQISSSLRYSVRSSPSPSSWIPHGYLVEAVFLAGLIVLALLLQYRRDVPWIKVVWGCLGALGAFCVLGAWTIGSGFLPSLLYGAGAGLVAAIRTKTHLPQLLFCALAGFVGQVFLMVLVILTFAVITGASLMP